MKIREIAFILFISSLFLVLPQFKSDVILDVFPYEKNSTVINIQSTKVGIASNVEARIFVTVSRLNQETGLKDIVFSGDLIGSIEVELDYRGFYLFEILSEKIAIITLTENSLPFPSIIFTALTTALYFAFDFKRLVIDRIRY
jgi:hypothetical protein